MFQGGDKESCRDKKTKNGDSQKSREVKILSWLSQRKEESQGTGVLEFLQEVHLYTRDRKTPLNR